MGALLRHMDLARPGHPQGVPLRAEITSQAIILSDPQGGWAVTSATSTPNKTLLGYLLRMGGLMALGYVALALLFQTAQMWVSPSVITARWNVVSRLAYAVLPDAWLNATPQSRLAPFILILYVTLLAFVFVVYLRAAGRGYESPPTTPAQGRKALLLVLGVAGVSLLALLVGRAMLSTDIYSYVWYGRIPALEGGNPYLDAPRLYLDRDIEGWMEWEIWNGALPCVYGPVWVFLAEGIAFLAQAIGGKELAAHVLGHRLLADMAHLLNIWLVWRVAGDFAGRMAGKVGAGRRWPGLQLGATLTYAWNPLLMLEFGLSGHNDSIMVSFLLVSIWLLLKGRWRWAAVALAAASLVKLMALIFLPFYLIWLWRMSRGEGDDNAIARASPGILAALLRSAQALAVVCACWLLAMWPFGGPLSLLDALKENPTVTLQVNSLAAVILVGIPSNLYHLGWVTDATTQNLDAFLFSVSEDYSPWVRWPQQALAGLLILFVLWRTWRSPDKGVRSIMEGWGWASLVYFMIGSPWFWPWYVAWLFVPLALLGPGRLWTAGQLLAASAMAIYAIFPPPAGLQGWQHYTGLLVVLPAAVYLLWSRKNGNI